MAKNKTPETKLQAANRRFVRNTKRMEATRLDRAEQIDRTPTESACLPSADSLTSMNPPATDEPVALPTIQSASLPENPAHGVKIMILTLKTINKRGTQAIYTGLRTAVRFPIAAFPNKTPVPSFEVTGEFAEPRKARASLTAEERKALRKAQPKLTQAERIAQMELRLAKAKTKLAASTATEQPADAVAM